ncbi:hypothetical protein [Streptomyces sp. NPDC013455]|uniref:hypothetical protein n=1 Tax=Streptomyces sp. NPDC013455 TaxID=3155605 RepID=UPI00340AB7C1
MVGSEIVQWVERAGPAVSTAVDAHGAEVLTRAEDAGDDATVRAGRRILQAVWRRGDEAGRTELERAVSEAAGAPEDPDTHAVVRQVLKRAMRDDPRLREELASLLPAPAPGVVNITASGTRSIAAHHIGTAVTGDGPAAHHIGTAITGDGPAARP